MSTSNYSQPPPHAPEGIRQCWMAMPIEAHKAITEQSAADAQRYHIGAPRGDPFPQNQAVNNFESSGSERQRLHMEQGYQHTWDPQLVTMNAPFQANQAGVCVLASKHVIYTYLCSTYTSLALSRFATLDI
jgi:hypothetical protein